MKSLYNIPLRASQTAELPSYRVNTPLTAIDLSQTRYLFKTNTKNYTSIESEAEHS